MGRSQREKGKRGEREFVNFLKEHGLSPRRTGFHQVDVGSGDAADVECEPMWVEVKIGARPPIMRGFAQAAAGAPKGWIPVCAHKQDRGRWMVTLLAEDLADLVREWRERGEG